MSKKAQIKRWGIIGAIFASFLMTILVGCVSNRTYAETCPTMTVDQINAGLTCEDVMNMQYTKDNPLCTTINNVKHCSYYDPSTKSWVSLNDEVCVTSNGVTTCTNSATNATTVAPENADCSTIVKYSQDHPDQTIYSMQTVTNCMRELAGDPVTTEPATEPETQPAGADPSVTSTTTTTTTAVPLTSADCIAMQQSIANGNNTYDMSDVTRCVRIVNGEEVDTDTGLSQSFNVNQEEIPETQQSKCYGDNPELGWAACPLADDLSNFITNLYDHMIEKWLIYPPQALNASNDAGKVTNKVWSDIRNIANALFIVYLLVIIFSQITGWQIQEYGIKKALPKVIIMIILVNLSYIICQGAVDISNILGRGVANIFDQLNQTVVLDAEGSSAISGTGALLILILVLVGIIFAAFFLGSAFLLPILMALLGAVFAIFFTFVMLVVRQALITGLIILSPLAIGCAALPGTEKLYKKWFGLFKGLLFTYPIASFLVYGGSFAGRLVVKTMGEDSFISGLIGIAVCVVPACFLPKITTSSVAAIDGAILKMKQNVTGRANKAIGESRMADKMKRQTQRRKIERASGTRIKKDGTVVMRRHFRTKHMNDHLGDAQRLGSQMKEIDNYRDKGYRRNVLDEQLISEADARLNRQGSFTSDQLAGMLGTNDDPAMDAAITRRLRQQGDNGRDALANRISQLETTGGAQAENALVNIAGELNRGREDLSKQDMVMADWARDVTRGGVMSAGRLSTRQLTNEQVQRTTGASFKTMDSRAVNNYLNQIRQNSGTQSAAHIQQSVQDLLKSTDVNELSVEKRQMLEQFASENLAGPVTGSWLS